MSNISLMKLKADVSGAIKPLKAVQNEWHKTGRAAYNANMKAVTSSYKAAAGIADMRKRMRQLRAASSGVAVRFNRIVTAMAGVGTTIVLFRTAAHSVVRFEKAMAEVGAITNANSEGFAMMSREAQRLGATTLFTASQAAEGLKFLSMAGLSAAEATKSLQATLNLAQAGAIDLGTAADIATNIMTAFKLEAKDLSDVVDDIATVASSSNTSIIQLGDAMKYVSASAASFGISLQETNAGIGVLSDAGMQASLAGTGLRQVFIRITGQSAAMRKGLQALGISFAEIDPSARSLTEILDRFARTSITAAEVSQMFGARAANAFNILLSGRDKLKALTKAQEENTGRAQEMADVMGNSLFGQLKKVQSAYEDLFQTMFNSGTVAETVGGFLNTISTALNVIAGKGEVFDSSNLEEFGSKVNESYQKVNNLIESFNQLVDVLKAVAVAFIALKIGAISSGFLALASRLGNASKSMLNLRKNAQSASATIGGLSKSIKGAAVAASTLGKSLSMGSGQMALSRASLAAMNFKMALKEVAVAAKGVGVAIMSALKPLIVVYAAFEALSFISNIFFKTAEEKAQSLNNKVRTLTDTVTQLSNTLANAEFQITVERNSAGTFEEKETQKGNTEEGNKIVPFAEIETFEQKNALIIENTKLLKANNREIEKNIAIIRDIKANDLNGLLDDEQKARIAEATKNVENLRKNSRQIERNIEIIKTDADDLIAQKENTKGIQRNVDALNKSLQESNRITTGNADSAVKAYLAQIRLVERLSARLEEVTDKTSEIGKIKFDTDFAKLQIEKQIAAILQIKGQKELLKQDTSAEELLIDNLNQKLNILANEFDVAAEKIKFSATTISGIGSSGSLGEEKDGKLVRTIDPIRGIEGSKQQEVSGENIDVEKTRSILQDIKNSLEDQKNQNIAKIDEQIAEFKKREQAGELSATDSARVAQLREMRESQTGFAGTTENPTKVIKGVSDVLTAVQKLLGGTGLFESEEMQNLPEQIQNTKQLPELKAILDALLNSALAKVDEIDTKKGESEITQKNKPALEKSIAESEAGVMKTQIEAVLAEKQKTEEIERQNQLLQLQSDLQSVIAKKIQLIKATEAQDPDDEAGVKQTQQSLEKLDSEERAIESKIQATQAEGTGESKELSSQIKTLGDKLTQEIAKINKLNISQEEKISKKEELKETTITNIQKDVQEKGDKERGIAVDKAALKDAEINKGNIQKQLQEEANKRREKADEAFSIAQSKASELGDGSGLVVDSMQAIGGGGGIGPLKQQETQVSLQKKANEILTKMLNILGAPKEFKDKAEAREEILKKTPQKDLNVMAVGFQDILKQAKEARENNDVGRLAELKQQATSLLDNASIQAKEKNFAINPIGQNAGDAKNFQNLQQQPPQIDLSLLNTTNNILRSIEKKISGQNNTPVKTRAPLNQLATQ